MDGAGHGTMAMGGKSMGGVWRSLNHVFVAVLSVVTITLPTMFVRMLSTTLTLQLDFTKIMLILLAVACIIYYVVRYRYLNVYERLRPEPPRKEPTVDLFPDSRDEGSKTGLHNYLDEFLSAIKMFGYLERPVFHELTRHMQTRRVAAGDTMLMEEEDSYCLVVDGKMQIFVRSNVEEPPEASNSPDDLGDSYRLLTEVTNGAPLSSLFSVLSLFTEHIDIWDAVKPKKANVSAEDTALLSPSPMASATASPAPFEEAAKTATAKPDSGRPGTQRDNIPDLPKFPLLSSEPGLEDGDSKPMSAKENSPAPTNKRPAPRRSVHPSIVARAVEDTTVAVIPASAFRRLSKTFPKASAHIVHVILARLQRVTFATGFRYLGLSRELVHMERMLNESLSYDLPSLLRNSAVQKLSERAKQEYAESKVKGFPIIVSRANGQRKIKSAKGSGASSPLFKPPTSPGDILSAADPLRHPSSLSKSTKPGSDAKVEGSFAKEIGDFDEDSAFRDSIRESMFKTLGIDEESRSHNVKMVSTASVSSVEASPRLLSYDSYRQRAVFSNAFGHMGPLETSADDESETNHSNVSVQSHVENDLEILFYPAGSTVIEQNQTDAGLFYVVDGFLDVTCPDALKDRPGESSGDHLFMVKPGGITGYQSSISGHKSFIQVIARSDCLVGRLSNECLEKIMDKQPQILLTLAKRLIELLPPMVLHLDFALEWVNVNAGQVIYQEGDPSDSIYIVLNGRLRTIHEKPESGSLHVESEYGHGDSIGELEVLTEIPRGATLHAIRDSELARFPSTLFNALALEYPQISVQLSRVIAHRVSQTLKQSKMQTESLQTSTSNLKTIGILPVATGAPIRQFAAKLHAALKAQGSSSIVLNQTSVLRHLGRHAFSRIGKLKLQGYLADLEEKYDIILYVADTSVSSPWTHTCIGQADLIFEVTASDADIGISEFERFLVGMKTTARKELVLLHRERYCPNGVTRQWLQNRIWIHSHHHVQMDYGVAEAEQLPHALRPALVSLKSKVQVLQSEISKYTSIRFGSNTYTNINKDSTDFSRIARRLTGRVIGLVLGGGGARGISQLGVLTAFEEAGIPIDIVGGTSIGAFNGGLYAQEAAVLPVYGRAKKFCGRMASMWRFVLDATYPTTSYTTGHEFNRGIWKTFKEAQIEDFWLPFYTNTTNISTSSMDIHSSGYAWRYIRASMTLAGLLPPMCDEGHMLVDGGYMDNLTVSHMKAMGASLIFAIDVGSVDSKDYMYYGDTLSGAWATFNRYNPFGKHPNVPTMAEIQARLAYVSSVTSLERAKQEPGCIYMRPPISNFQTLDFGKFSEIYRIGYAYGNEVIQRLKSEGKLDAFLPQPNNGNSPKPVGPPGEYQKTRRMSL